MGMPPTLETWLDSSSSLGMGVLSISILTVLTCIILGMCMIRRDQRSMGVPEPPALPIIGHLHLFGKLPHQVLMGLARQYGPLMSVRLGGLRYLVASNAEMAKELLKTQDAMWASRPSTLFGEVFFYNMSGAILQPQNDYWRRMRKMYISELLAPAQVEKQKDKRDDSTMYLLNSLLATQQDNEVVDICYAIREMNFYQMTKLVFGFKASGRRTAVKTLDEIIRNLTNIDFLSLGECLPYLKWLDIDQVGSKMRKLHTEYDTFLCEQMEMRRRQLLDDPDDDSTDFSRSILSLLDSKDGNGLTLNNAKAAITDMFLAGIETTGSATAALLTEVMRHPEVKRKLVEELDDVVGRGRLVVESDLVNLKYLKMVIKEVLRLHPVVPLMLPHKSSMPTVVGGYKIPADTSLFVNVYAIHRDPDLWEDPLTFKPERFLDNSIDVRGQHFQLLPFGSGRRICPGMNMAWASMELVVSRLFHSLDIQLPPGMQPGDVDMTERTGAVTSFLHPIKVVISPRFPLEMYRTS